MMTSYLASITLISVFILFFFFFFNDTATTEIYTLSLHDALPICARRPPAQRRCRGPRPPGTPRGRRGRERSEEHTSELQSPCNLVCRLLLEKKKKKKSTTKHQYQQRRLSDAVRDSRERSPKYVTQ